MMNDYSYCRGNCLSIPSKVCFVFFIMQAFAVGQLVSPSGELLSKHKPEILSYDDQIVVPKLLATSFANSSTLKAPIVDVNGSIFWDKTLAKFFGVGIQAPLKTSAVGSAKAGIDLIINNYSISEDLRLETRQSVGMWGVWFDAAVVNLYSIDSEQSWRSGIEKILPLFKSCQKFEVMKTEDGFVSGYVKFPGLMPMPLPLQKIGFISTRRGILIYGRKELEGTGVSVWPTLDSNRDWFTNSRFP